MHTLVVGGTGMLAGVSRWLVEQGDVVSVFSRRIGQVLEGDTAGRLNHFAVDYRESSMLRQLVREAISIHGPIQLAIFWIRSDAPDAFQIISDGISSSSEVPWRLFHVRGSATHLHPDLPQVSPNCLYHQVVLGFVLEENRSRWLTHEEISGGVIEAIQSHRARTVVGTLEPWEKRPR